MLFFSHLKCTAALFLVRSIFATDVSVSTQASSSRKSPNSNVHQKKADNGICKFRVINHITDQLPQQCLKNAWNATGSMAASEIGGIKEELGNITATVLEITSSVIKEVIQELPLSTATEAAQTKESVLGVSQDQSAFLSFEEWRKQTLEKAGQKENNGQKKVTDIKRQESDAYQKNLDTPVGEGTIDLQNSALDSGVKKEETVTRQEDGKTDKTLHVEKIKESYRSKDAGKTCKERFSYASFDAGATVLKTHLGAKNAKNILIENKDSYMLSECSVKNKFIIIELSEDIWIDTVVLANYEFFSSMIRTFRVSVSDRYPVKMDKWKEVGTYEARNSREIQAFLIENPQIWARYVRFEFLDHYGTEYYCPLSLVRVHGTRMLESWKETEAAGESEDEDTDESVSPEEVNAVLSETFSEEKEVNETGATDSEATQIPIAKDFTTSDSNRVAVDKTSWKDPGFYIFNAGHTPPLDGVCSLDDLNSQLIVVDVIETITVNSTNESMSTGNKKLISELSIGSLSSIKDHTKNITLGILNQSSSSITQVSSPALSPSEISRNSHISHGKSSQGNINSHNTSSTSTIPKDKVSTQTTSSSSSLPTIQESFFKAVSRRLTLLESNSTLSLAYISEATSHLHQAFAALSRNITRAQLTKTTVFLDAINSTVLSELRRFSQQYDEIWQSTVISLESQKEDSRRQTLAISERLNILAQEVVWQRRMSMIQSVLLLLCLGIMIFSRVSTSSEQFFLRPRSRVSTNSRQYNDGFSSDPATPFPWLDTPNRTPISQNSPQNPILNNILL
ncbi:hypothetical protein HI914_04425 [Erysiphe necator]|nr:hypothetical protein HI914_04425 [Erysiphe necator]